MNFRKFQDYVSKVSDNIVNTYENMYKYSDDINFGKVSVEEWSLSMTLKMNSSNVDVSDVIKMTDDLPKDIMSEFITHNVISIDKVEIDKKYSIIGSDVSECKLQLTFHCLCVNMNGVNKIERSTYFNEDEEMFSYMIVINGEHKIYPLSQIVCDSICRFFVKDKCSLPN